MRRLPLLGLLLAASPLPAQTASPQARAAASITSADVARRVGIIADDSMMGRDTPSRGLELTAKYVADQFKSFGLKPGGENGTWFQRYPITRRRLELARSRVIFSAGATVDSAPLTRSARLVSGPVADTAVSGPTVLVGGALTPEVVGRFDLKDKVVLYPLDFSKPIRGNSTRVIRAIRLSREPRGHHAHQPGFRGVRRAPAPHRPRSDRCGGRTAGPARRRGRASAPPGGRSRRQGWISPRRGARRRPCYREVPGLTIRVQLRDSVLVVRYRAQYGRHPAGQRPEAQGASTSSSPRTWTTSASAPGAARTASTTAPTTTARAPSA